MCKRLFLPMCFLLAVGAGVTASAADDPHLMVWYKLDEASGTTAHDDSVYGRDAVVDGPANWDPGDGQFGGSLVFNDDTDVEVPTSALSTISTGITVSVWLKDASRPGVNNWVFEAQGTGGSIVRAAVVVTTGEVLWRAGNSSNDQLSWDLGGVDHTTLKGWHHWVFVKDEVTGYICIYFDGESVASSDVVDSTLANVQGAQLRFGVGSGHANDFIGKMDDIRVYDWALAAHAVRWLYTGVLETASAPDPKNRAEDICRGVTLSWIPGMYADKHDVYFGTVFNDVNDADRVNPLGVLASQSQDANTYAPGVLEYGQTYYWRIDEVNNADPASPWKGEVWSFTVEPYSYAMRNIIATASSSQSDDTRPQKTVDGSGLNSSDLHSTDAKDMWLSDVSGLQPTWIRYEFDGIYKLHEMWVWNQNQVVEGTVGFGAKHVTIEYSTDGVDWLALGGFEFAQAPGLDDYAHNTTVDFGGVPAKYVRLTVNSNWGGIVPQYGLSEVRFMYIPTYAREPKPADGAMNVSVDTGLSWRAAPEAALHEVYLSSDEKAVADGTALVGAVAESRYDPGALNLRATYYWKINEVNEAADPSIWEGAVWTFSTQEYLVVDDFESYNDLDTSDPESNRIYLTWIDGWEVPANGSQVGYTEPPFCEQTIVHGGKQSMPLAYNNTTGVVNSEARRTFDVPQDWTAHGADTLMLYFRGRPVAFLQRADGSIVMSGAGADIWEMADEFRFAYKHLNGNGSIVARVDSLVDTDPWAKVGVMIRETLQLGSKFAAVYITPGNGCRFQARTAAPGSAIGDDAVATPEQIAIRAPYWVKLERSGDVFNGFYSANGTSWTPMSWNPQTILMQGNIYIGLAVTSHSEGNPTTTVFSGVASTGSVTGQWQNEAIGVEQPSNDLAPLYVAVEDSMGRVKAVTHPDETAVGIGSWLPWQIPLSTFSSAGVDVAKVKTMYIGVGDRENPTPGGAGLLYIDDIQFGLGPEAPVPTIAHWQFNGTAGQEIVTDTDIESGYVAHKFYDASYVVNAATDVFYGLPNPMYDTGGTSAEFMNDPGDNDPGVGLVVPDTGVDILLDLSTLGAFTIEAFIHPYSLRQSVIVRKYGGGPGQYYIDLRPDGDVQFSINSDGNAAAAGAGAVTENEWYHVAAVFDETDIEAPMKIYINGELKGTAAFRDRPGDSPRALGIGAIIRDNNNPPGNSGQFFHGRIDEVRLSGSALSVDDFLLNR